MGMILGDAHTRRRANWKLTAEWTISHSERYADLVEWKRNEFVELFGIKRPAIRKRPNGKGTKCIFSFSAGKRLRVASQWLSKDKKKYITHKIKFMDHPIGLAMLLCDDGSVRKRKKFHKDGSLYYLKPSFTIATHNFSREEVQRLLDHVSAAFGISGIINPERRWRNGKKKEYYRCHFNVENSNKLWYITAPYMPAISSVKTKFAYAYECFGHNGGHP